MMIVVIFGKFLSVAFKGIFSVLERQEEHRRAPQHLMECCILLSYIAGGQHLWFASCHRLFVPRHRSSMFGRRALSLAGLMA